MKKYIFILILILSLSFLFFACSKDSLNNKVFHDVYFIEVEGQSVIHPKKIEHGKTLQTIMEVPKSKTKKFLTWRLINNEGKDFNHDTDPVLSDLKLFPVWIEKEFFTLTFYKRVENTSGSDTYTLVKKLLIKNGDDLTNYKKDFPFKKFYSFKYFIKPYQNHEITEKTVLKEDLEVVLYGRLVGYNEDYFNYSNTDKIMGFSEKAIKENMDFSFIMFPNINAIKKLNDSLFHIDPTFSNELKSANKKAGEIKKIFIPKSLFQQTSLTFFNCSSELVIFTDYKENDFKNDKKKIKVFKGNFEKSEDDITKDVKIIYNIKDSEYANTI